MLKKFLRRNVDTPDRKVDEDLADATVTGEVGEDQNNADEGSDETSGEASGDSSDESGPDGPAEPEPSENPADPDTPQDSGEGAEPMEGEDENPNGEDGEDTAAGEDRAAGETGEVEESEEFSPALRERLEKLIAAAYAEGEKAGRNTRIEELLEERTDEGDGVGRLDGKPDSWSQTPFGSIFDLALSAR